MQIQFFLESEFGKHEAKKKSVNRGICFKILQNIY